MPRLRDSRLTVVSELKALSDEADRYADDFPLQSAINAWFSTVKDTFIRIRDCTSIDDIATEYPPDYLSMFGQEKPSRTAKPEVTDIQKGHIHLKNSSESKKDEALDGKETKSKSIPEAHVISTSICQNEIKVSDGKNEVLHEIVLSSNKKVTPESASCFSCTPKLKLKIPFKKSVFQSGTTNSVERFYTPVMDKTFNKVADSTIVIDSGNSSTNYNPCKTVDSTFSSSGIKTRSSIKRKSTMGKDESNKKQKTNVPRDLPAVTCTSATKVIYPKYAVEKVINLKTVPAENKSKACAVIIPSLKLKMTPQSKEKLVLEEIKKKEEKANENRRRVLAERQMKAEENKKKREEKIEKTKQNRLKIEKEKEKLVVETIKPQAPKEVIKKPGLKTRVKELIDQNAKENKSKSSGSLKHTEVNQEGFKTPVSKASDANESFVNYDLTPVPDSSTYEYSDDDDNQPKKPVPNWAQGYALKSVLISQYYNNPDTDDIFGRYIDPPDLVAIFKIQKKRYKTRTSSAIWNTPPDRSLRY